MDPNTNNTSNNTYGAGAFSSDPFPPSGFPTDEEVRQRPTATTPIIDTTNRPQEIDDTNNGSILSRFQNYWQPGVFYGNNDPQQQQQQEGDAEEIELEEKVDETPTMEDDIIQNETYIKSLNAEERRNKVREGIRTGSLLLLGLLAIGFLLIYLDFIMIPLVFSRGLVYVFQPFINFIVGKKPLPFCKKRLHLPRWFGVFLCVILIAVCMFLIVLLIEYSAREVMLEKESYKRRYDEIYANFVAFAERLGYTQAQIEAFLEQVDLGGYVFDLISSFFEVLPNTFIILLFTLYMLLDYDEKAHKSKLRIQVDNQIRQYIIIKVGVSVFVGFVVTLIFLCLGAHLAIFFGLATFLLNFIPNIGAIVATFLPMPVVIFDPNMNLIKILIAFWGPFTVHMFVGNVAEPKVIGHSLEMPPVSVLVVLMFWESVWGILGALISVPLTVAITTYLQTMDHPMPRLLAGMLMGDFSFLESSMEEEKEKALATHHTTETVVEVKH